MEGAKLTVCAPVLPHAVPVAGALVQGSHTWLPVEAIRHHHPFHVAAPREPQKPAHRTRFGICGPDLLMIIGPPY